MLGLDQGPGGPPLTGAHGVGQGHNHLLHDVRGDKVEDKTHFLSFSALYLSHLLEKCNGGIKTIGHVLRIGYGLCLGVI